MNFKIIENSQNKVTQPEWSESINLKGWGYWASPSSVEQWLEENPKFNLFLQYYGIEEIFIKLNFAGLEYKNLYNYFKDKPEILTKMFIFLNNIKDFLFNTPFRFSCYFNITTLIEQLFSIQNEFDYNILAIICSNNNYKIAKLLIDNNITQSINTPDINEILPLKYAYDRDNIKLAKLLLNNGAFVFRGVDMLHPSKVPLLNSIYDNNIKFTKLFYEYTTKDDREYLLHYVVNNPNISKSIKNIINNKKEK